MTAYVPLTDAELEDAVNMAEQVDALYGYGEVEYSLNDYLRRLVAEVRSWRSCIPQAVVLPITYAVPIGTTPVSLGKMRARLNADGTCTLVPVEDEP